MKFGQFEIYALSDGLFKLDGGQMFGVVPKTLWEKKAPADERNRIRMGLTCLLVKAGGKNILIEAGIGEKFDAKRTDIYAVDHSQRHLLRDLAAHGITPEDIDLVINTHLHFDHCGWNTRRENGRTIPTFPRARYFVQRGEWEHALNPTEKDRGSYFEEFFAAAEPQTEMLDGPAEILPGIRVELAPGHVRELQCVWIESEGNRACFVSDLVPMRHHLAYPWIMAFDLYPMETLASKKRWLPELAREQVLVILPHDPDAAWGRVVDRDGKFGFEPVAEE